MTKTSTLDIYLRKSTNASSRELLLTSRLIHDLTVAAAARQYDLLVYTPTVDCDGFDLIIDDRDNLLPLQLKSMMSDGKVQDWAIHRHLLLPKIHEIEWFGFEPSAVGEGRGGGVLLIKIQANDSSVDVQYQYTDIKILTAMWLGLIKLKKPSRKRLERLRMELSETPGGKVNVPRSAFVKAKSPEHLLALMGMHSRHNTCWPNLLYDLVKYNNLGIQPKSAPINIIRESLSNDLKELCIK